MRYVEEYFISCVNTLLRNTSNKLAATHSIKLPNLTKKGRCVYVCDSTAQGEVQLRHVVG